MALAVSKGGSPLVPFVHELLGGLLPLHQALGHGVKGLQHHPRALFEGDVAVVDGDHLPRADGVLRAVPVLEDDQQVALVHCDLGLAGVVHVQDVRLLHVHVAIGKVVAPEERRGEKSREEPLQEGRS